MNDLSGLSWNSPVKSSSSRQTLSSAPPTTASNGVNHLSRGSTPLSGPASGRATPVNNPGGLSAPNRKNDTFASLLASSSSKPSSGGSLQERQRQLQRENERQSEEHQKRRDEQFRSNDASFWENLGSRAGGEEKGRARLAKPVAHQDDDEDDLLAAFNASAPIDSSSHFPPPQASPSLSTSQHIEPQRLSRGPSPRPLATPVQLDALHSDDDPFGLAHFEQKQKTSRPTPQPATTDDDDILGDLGKPFDPSQASETSAVRKRSPQRASNVSPTMDHALAELVEMGFPAEKAQVALAATATGTDIQAAIGILINQAHQASRSKGAPHRAEQERNHIHKESSSKSSTRPRDAKDSSAMRDTSEARSDSAAREKDVGQYASEIGNAFFKQANSLWKTSQKRVQKAMAELQQEQNDSHPKWMKEAQARARTGDEPGGGGRQQTSDVTSEAAMLESGRSKPRPTKASAPRHDTQKREPQVMEERRMQRPLSAPLGPKERLSRQNIEEQTAQAYISPARRRKPQPPPESPPPISRPETNEGPARAEMDIFADEQPVAPPQPARVTPSPSASTARSSISSRPRPATARSVPQTSPQALSQSTSHRQAGSEAFKRGDFAAATESYTLALSSLPPAHPLTIILRCNRSLTNLRTGDARAALLDADTAISVIGGTKGEGEAIALGPGEPSKSMKEFFGKALMRKAEALEHLEKWADAGIVWQTCIENGVGAATAVQGRARCEKAGAPVADANSGAPARPPVSARKATPRSTRSAASDLAPSGQDSAAVKRLREQNAASAAAADEAFALSDSVSARLDAWKAGKQDNMRALLASLDTVLWQGAEWKKVGMGELVMPNKVKIVYMKAIARVHPDKIPQNATTEQKMISAAVFAVLNEAWDGFKVQNNL